MGSSTFLGTITYPPWKGALLSPWCSELPACDMFSRSLEGNARLEAVCQMGSDDHITWYFTNLDFSEMTGNQHLENEFGKNTDGILPTWISHDFTEIAWKFASHSRYILKGVRGTRGQTSFLGFPAPGFFIPPVLHWLPKTEESMGCQQDPYATFHV